MERTLVILKPDTMHRGLVGRILARFEEKSLALLALKMITIDEGLARRHYAAHLDKPFFPPLLTYITSSPVIVAVLAGPMAITVVRKMLGETFGFDAEPGTIRGDFGNSRGHNLVHASDSAAAAQQEISLYFRPEEIQSWVPAYMGPAYEEEELQ